MYFEILSKKLVFLGLFNNKKLFKVVAEENCLHGSNFHENCAEISQKQGQE
jgi:hypothetical protein